MRPAAALFCFLLSGLGFQVTQARAQDFQVWNEIDLTASLRNVDFLVPLLARTDSRLPNPQLAATGITADVHLPWQLTLTGGYLFADLPQRSIQVHIPLLALSKAFHFHGFSLADRNRFEKLMDYPRSPVRYRNRVLLDRPLGSRGQWHVFASDEIFFDFSASQWNQNRFQVGGGARLAPRLFLDAYYLQRNPRGNPLTTGVLGTTLRVSLGAGKKRKQP